MNEGAFGTAETLSKAKNTAINALVDDGLITARAGKVKLVSRNDLPEDWNPTTDERLTAWESTQYLIRALEQKGESGTAELLKKLGSGMGETARDLAYRLYVICDRKKWTTEALSYNSLITSWSEIQNLVHAAERSQRGQQTLAGENE
jgi:putative DNA methylase